MAAGTDEPHGNPDRNTFPDPLKAYNVDNRLRRLKDVFGLNSDDAENEDVEDTVVDDVDLFDDEP